MSDAVRLTIPNCMLFTVRTAVNPKKICYCEGGRRLVPRFGMGGCSSRANEAVGVELASCTLISRLEDFPEELLGLIASHLLATDLPGLLHFCATTKVLHTKMAQLREAAAERRVRWVNEMNVSHAISDEDRTLTLSSGYKPWCTGVPLPTEGRYSLSMRCKNGNGGHALVGVCNSKRLGWGVCLSSGKMKSFVYPEGQALAVGWQDTHVIFDETGRQTNLKTKAKGSVIEIVVDRGEGWIAFGFNGSAPYRVPGLTIPPSTELRPWARMYGYMGDALGMRGYYQPEDGSEAL